MKVKQKKLLLTCAMVIFLIVTVFLGFLLVYGNSTNRKISKRLEIGANYISTLDYDAAILIYEEVLKLDPKNLEAYEQIIKAYDKKGDFENAVKFAMSGYENTGSEVLRGLIAEMTEKAEKNVISANLPFDENAFENNAIPADENTIEDDAISSDESEYNEGDIIIEAVVHEGNSVSHSYCFHTFSQEEKHILEELIGYVEEENYEKVLSVSRESAMKELVNRCGDEYGRAYVVFNNRKIAISIGSNLIDISVIPVDEGIGYIMLRNEFGKAYCSGECSEGVFNGKFKSKSGQKVYAEGYAKNGLYDGIVTYYSDDSESSREFTLGCVAENNSYESTIKSVVDSVEWHVSDGGLVWLPY